MIYWQNLQPEIVDMIKNPKYQTTFMSEEDFYSTENPPRTGMFIVSPSVGGTHLPSRDTFAFVSIFNPEVIEYDNNGTTEQYKVRVVHAMRMTGLDNSVDGMEWFDYTLYRPSDQGWNAPTPVGKNGKEIYERIGYTAEWVPVDVKIINNLVDGGESNALSAEQGKELKRLIDNIEPFSDVDKAKLDGIEEGANKYELPIASDTVLGGIKIDEESFEIMSDGIMKSKVRPSMIQGVVKEVNNQLPDADGKVTITADDVNAYTKTEVNNELDKKVNLIDIVDNLTSTDATKVLSAKQGNELREMIENGTLPDTVMQKITFPSTIYYFNSNGDDETGDGTQDKPYKDFNKFLRQLDGKYLNMQLRIDIQGDYSEFNPNTGETTYPSLYLTNAFGRVLTIVTDRNTPTKLDMINISYNMIADLTVSNFECSTVYQYHGYSTTYGNIKAKSTTFSGFNIQGGDRILINSCSVEGNNYGVVSQRGSNVICYQLSGNVRTTAYRAVSSSTIKVFENTMAAPVQTDASLGGEVIIR